jgi:geranylgeranyl diphosphate synthase type II
MYPGRVLHSAAVVERELGEPLGDQDSPLPDLVSSYLADCRRLVIAEIKSFVPTDSRYQSVLYDLMLDYPLREAKALRPALCIATCRALGGALSGVLKSAATLEFYHNAFLIHDDIEDGSEKRRDRATLHRLHGSPIALNVGDAMLALALEPMLDNTRVLGLGKSLRILQCVARMARESAEGQALELAWIRAGQFELGENDYARMVHKKTSWYTFITPMKVGAIAAGAGERESALLGRSATLLGLAFQIQDDVLNLSADEAAYGKELSGDLWEGKHTLILMHALAHCDAVERARAIEILRKPRPASREVNGLGALLLRLRSEGMLSDAAWQELAAHQDSYHSREKSADEVAFLRDLIRRQRSIEYARAAAVVRARRARRLMNGLTARPSVHLRFLQGVADFAIGRDR